MEWKVMGEMDDPRQERAKALVYRLVAVLGNERDFSVVLSASTSLLAFVIHRIKIESGRDMLATVSQSLREGIAEYDKHDIEHN